MGAVCVLLLLIRSFLLMISSRNDGPEEGVLCVVGMLHGHALIVQEALDLLLEAPPVALRQTFLLCGQRLSTAHL